MRKSFSPALIIVAVLAAGVWLQPGFAKVPADNKSVAAFRIVESVVAHPRCANCHSTSNWPTQGDDRHRHTFNVLRGDDGRGAMGMKCATCHLDHNQEAGNVPGTKDWHMAPLSMGWAGLSGGLLCKALLDPTRNGGRSGEKVIEHLRADPVVLWAWTPGGKRTIPPVSHDRFMVAAQAWIGKGAQCPQP
jgi:hypothetical protein